MSNRHHARRWNVLTSLLLAALLFRAYIPVGFMPAAGTPFLLELCPDAGAVPMPMDMSMPKDMSMPMPAGHQHHAHSPGHLHFQHCPFGSVPASGPISQLVLFQPPGRLGADVDAVVLTVPPGAQPLRAHQPRGPPVSI